MSSSKFSVAIVGGGIGGLTLAIALSKYPDIDVVVYEAATQITTAGAGITLGMRPWEIMQRLDLEEELLKVTGNKPNFGTTQIFSARKSDQPEPFRYYDIPSEGSLMAFHRADFQGVLLRILPNTCQVLCSKRLASYNHVPDGIELFFVDGSTAKCDVLIGVDGYKSTVRRIMVEQRAKLASADLASEIRSAADPLWTGINAYRAVIPAEKIRAERPDHSILTDGTPTQYSGCKAFLVAYPIQHGKFINMAGIHPQFHLENTKYDGPSVVAADKSELISLFKDFEPEVQTLVKNADQISKWAIYAVKPMDTFVHNNVAVMGDAAHAMTPFLGAGASQAVEDAYILAAALGHPNTTRDTIAYALEVYDTIRRPLSLDLQARSRLNGRLSNLMLDGVDLSNRTNREDLWDDLQIIGKMSSELMPKGSAQTSYEEAMRLLKMVKQ